MSMVRGRTELVLAIVTIVAMNLLWIFPPAGIVAALVVMVVVPPWGRSLTERGVISMLLLLGTLAIAVPRASTMPLTATTAHIGLAVFLAILMGLRFIPGLQRPVPRPTRVDALIGVFIVASGAWLVSAYIGKGPWELLSGLYFSGWDNQGHFTPFANTVEAGATLWPTIDGSVAWNQWYPSLHTTVWALAQLGAQASGQLVDRVDLLWPYIQWSALSFTLSLAALAWVASDLARRGVRAILPSGHWQARWAPVLAILAFAAFAVFGSPAWLFNYGFVNFVMAVAVMTTTAYLSARSWASARTIGWILIPLGVLAINGLWTPLLVAIVLFRGRRPALAVAVASTSIGTAAFLALTMYAAHAAGVARLYSYYVLKTLDALLLTNAPLLAALAGIAGALAIHAMKRHVDDASERSFINKTNAAITTAAALVLGFLAFGYVGPHPVEFAPGFAGAPGIEAAAVRTGGAQNALVGESIIEAQRAARQYPGLNTMLWDGAGTLPNLWLASLHGTLSMTAHDFYKNLPAFPYDAKTADYVNFSLGVNSDLDLAIMYFRDVSKDLVAPLAQRNPGRVTVVRVPMRPSPLCLECSL